MKMHAPGTGFWHWMFGFKGRINRADWWLGLLTTAGLCVGGGFLMMVLTWAALLLTFPSLREGRPAGSPGDPAGSEGFIAALNYVPLAFASLAALITVWCVMALSFKRFHDRSMTGWRALVPLLVPLACTMILLPLVPEEAPVLVTALLIPWGTAWLWGLIHLGILPGTSGPNRYGSDPQQQASVAETFA
jgi:uncharacterized membrane protein YhaH (DUF805 family)